MPKFCPRCEKSMDLSTATGRIIFKCSICSEQVEGNDYDVKMPGSFHATEESTELWINIIRNAPFDRVSEKVARTCTICKRDYMVQLRLGKNESVIYSCKCGYNSLTDKNTKLKSEMKTNITGKSENLGGN